MNKVAFLFETVFTAAEYNLLIIKSKAVKGLNLKSFLRAMPDNSNRSSAGFHILPIYLKS
jgi:hypothetical protein